MSVAQLVRYKCDILDMAEVRQIGFNTTTAAEIHRLWNSGEEQKNQHGYVVLYTAKAADT